MKDTVADFISDYNYTEIYESLKLRFFHHWSKWFYCQGFLRYTITGPLLNTLNFHIILTYSVQFCTII